MTRTDEACSFPQALLCDVGANELGLLELASCKRLNKDNRGMCQLDLTVGTFSRLIRISVRGNGYVPDRRALHEKL
jgi:hypothetical protein